MSTLVARLAEQLLPTARISKRDFSPQKNIIFRVFSGWKRFEFRRGHRTFEPVCPLDPALIER